MGQEIVKWDERLAADAARYADEEAGGGLFVTTRGGVLRFGEEELPGNQMCVVILDAIRENTFYPDKFDPDAQQPPKCYAFGYGDDMAPHESMQAHPYFEPQSEQCTGCPHAEWGTADTGRGKACQSRRRLAIIPAGMFVKKKGSRDFDLELFDDPKHYATADIAFFKLPVTSVKSWAKYVGALNATVRRPPYAVISRVYLEPDAKHQFKVHFEMVEELPDELAATIIARHDEASKCIITPYSPPDDAAEPRQGVARGLRGRK